MQKISRSLTRVNSSQDAYQAALDQLTKVEHRLYSRLRRWLRSKRKNGLPLYVTPSRAWLAEHFGKCHVDTITRFFRHVSALGLLKIVHRRKRGFRKQPPNLITLPDALTRPVRPIRVPTSELDIFPRDIPGQKKVSKIMVPSGDLKMFFDRWMARGRGSSAVELV